MMDTNSLAWERGITIYDYGEKCLCLIRWRPEKHYRQAGSRRFRRRGGPWDGSSGNFPRQGTLIIVALKESMRKLVTAAVSRTPPSRMDANPGCNRSAAGKGFQGREAGRTGPTETTCGSIPPARDCLARAHKLMEAFAHADDLVRDKRARCSVRRRIFARCKDGCFGYKPPSAFPEDAVYAAPPFTCRLYRDTKTSSECWDAFVWHQYRI